MPGNIASRDIKTLGIVLRRTNYGEADRILNLITPNGKIAAIAKGVRKSRSKLAGGVEMFTLSELQIHQGRSELGVVTSAKMVQYYKGILADFGRMELAGMVLKQISKVAEQVEGAEYFDITRQCLENLDKGVGVKLVESWFWLNLLRVSGEEMNLYRDAEGEKLVEGANYEWNAYERIFSKNEYGGYGTDEIKLLRIMSRMDLGVISKIRMEQDTIDKVYDIIKTWEN